MSERDRASAVRRAVLRTWRREVIRVRDAEHPVISEAYLRNPYAD